MKNSQTVPRNVPQKDQAFIMTNALLECAIAENIDSNDLILWQGKSGAWYITSREKYANGKYIKCYFKKSF